MASEENKPITQPQQKEVEGKVASVENAVGKAEKTAGTAAVGAGVGAQATGAGLKVTGKAVGAVGRGINTAGSALSGTAIGAVVGVPLKGVGIATTGVGRGVEATGKGLEKSGRVVRRRGSATRRQGRRLVRHSHRVGKKTKMRIGALQALLMIGVSVLFDIAELILAFFAIGLIINRIIVIVKWVIFLLWFWFNGVHIIRNPKRRATAGITAIAGLIPIIGALPEFTIGIILTIKDARREDRVGKNPPTPKQKGSRRQNQRREEREGAQGKRMASGRRKRSVGKGVTSKVKK